MRLVNRHWCNAISQSLHELAPAPNRFYCMDSRLSKVRFCGIKKLVLRDQEALCDLWLERIKELLPQLETLSVRYTSPTGGKDITNEGIRLISKMDRVVHLELSGCQFLTPSRVRDLSHKENLTYLDLSRSNISNRFMLPIALMKNLEYLDLSENAQLSGVGIQVLTTLTKLRHLCLKGCKKVSEDELREISNFISLKNLDLRMCPKITGLSFQWFVSSQLTSLDLSDCTALSDSSLAYIQQLKCLRNLVLQNCSQITDKGLSFISNNPCIKYLRLGGSHGISDEGLKCLSQCINLQSLSLLFLNGITTHGIQFVISIDNLQYLSIIECRNVSNIKATGLSLSKKSKVLVIEQYPSSFETGN
eukprot:g7123.t1